MQREGSRGGAEPTFMYGSQTCRAGGQRESSSSSSNTWSLPTTRCTLPR